MVTYCACALVDIANRAGEFSKPVVSCTAVGQGGSAAVLLSAWLSAGAKRRQLLPYSLAGRQQTDLVTKVCQVTEQKLETKPLLSPTGGRLKWGVQSACCSSPDSSETVEEDFHYFKEDTSFYLCLKRWSQQFSGTAKTEFSQA